MRSIKRKFEKVEKKHPEWSSYIVFADAIYGQKFCRDVVMKHFNKLVKKDDYEKKDKKAILRFLVSLSNELRKGQNHLETAEKEASTEDCELVYIYEDLTDKQ
jgi:hypothetical protein